MDSHPRPPWQKRLSSRHWRALDVAVAVVLAPLMLVTIARHPAHHHLPAWAIVTLTLLAATPIAARRRWPTAALGTVVLAGAVLSADRLLPVPSLAPLAPALATYTVAVRLPRRRSAVALLVAVAGALIGPAAGIVVGLLAAGTGWTVGVLVRQQRGYADWLREQAAHQAAADERLRIARELHDVVSHSMSTIVVRAGVANHLADDEPDEARRALADIEAAGRVGLTDLRHLLGVLRTAPHPDLASLGPVPGLSDLDRLVTQVSQTGVGIDLRISGHPRAVPAGVGMSVYRIAQEALTNVVRHAGAAHGTVTVGYRPHEVSIEVTDDGRGGRVDGRAGHGLIGMRERVGIYGGRFTAGPLPGRGFRVEAVIPLGEAER